MRLQPENPRKFNQRVGIAVLTITAEAIVVNSILISIFFHFLPSPSETSDKPRRLCIYFQNRGHVAAFLYRVVTH